MGNENMKAEPTNAAGEALLYLEDLKTGIFGEFGALTLNKDEMISFSRQYDPQAFHVDEKAAKDSIYGGIIASGLHTLSVLWRQLCDGFALKVSGQGSPGMSSIRWLHPVRPGDTLRTRLEIQKIAPPSNMPGVGRVTLKCLILNQTDKKVLSVSATGLVQSRLREGG